MPKLSSHFPVACSRATLAIEQLGHTVHSGEPERSPQSAAARQSTGLLAAGEEREMRGYRDSHAPPLPIPASVPNVTVKGCIKMVGAAIRDVSRGVINVAGIVGAMDRSESKLVLFLAVFWGVLLARGEPLLRLSGIAALLLAGVAVRMPRQRPA
jgi:hypothetical protein